MNDPFEEGKLAAANGEPLSANPYPASREERSLWGEGWHYFHEVDEEGEPRDE